MSSNLITVCVERAPGARLSCDDRAALGRYQVQVESGWLLWPSERLAAAVLDGFHEEVALDDPGSVDISVYANGEEVFEDYEAIDAAQGQRASGFYRLDN